MKLLKYPFYKLTSFLKAMKKNLIRLYKHFKVYFRIKIMKLHFYYLVLLQHVTHLINKIEKDQ